MSSLEDTPGVRRNSAWKVRIVTSMRLPGSKWRSGRDMGFDQEDASCVADLTLRRREKENMRTLLSGHFAAAAKRPQQRSAWLLTGRALHGAAAKRPAPHEAAPHEAPRAPPQSRQPPTAATNRPATRSGAADGPRCSARRARGP